MKCVSGALALATFVFGLGGAASAEEWVDYKPMKGVWLKTAVHVDAYRIDDYLVGLKKTWVPEEENLKKHGLIDRYAVQVSVEAQGTEPNVMLLEHFVSLATFDPERERDVTIRKEEEQMLPKAQGESVQTERKTYRTIVAQKMWTDVDFSK